MARRRGSVPHGWIELWRVAGGTERGRVARHAEVIEDGANQVRSFDGGEQSHSAAAAGALEDVDAECAAHELRPGVVASGGTGACRWTVALWCPMGADAWAGRS